MSDTMTEGPRTYQSAWRFGPAGTLVLLSAEAWLEEEADVDEAVSKDDDDGLDDGPSRAGVLRAIAKEVATLRAERTQWAEAFTELTSLRSAARLGSALREAEESAVEDFAEYLMTQFGATIQREKLPSIAKAWLRMLRESAPVVEDEGGER